MHLQGIKASFKKMQGLYMVSGDVDAFLLSDPFKLPTSQRSGQ